MKYIVLSIFLLAASCNKTPQDDAPKLNGSTLKSDCDLVGVVRDGDGKGIAGVAVSDGYSYCTTDANGVYQMKANAKARTVNVVVPSEYKIPVEDGCPAHYALLDRSGKTMLNNFKLEKLAAPETEFSIIALGDQHLRDATWASRFQNETLTDVRNSIPGMKNPYIFALGDLMHYFSPEAYGLDDVKKIAVNQGDVVFFNCIGNHDHDQTVENYSTDEDYLSAGPWIQHFGPTDYAIDRGGVHIVVMDNVVAHGNSKDNGGAGKNTNCHGGFSPAQIKWLQEDFATVKDKSSKTVLLLCHIPFLEGNPAGSTSTSLVRIDEGYAAILTLLRQFGQAHILSGHLHTPVRYAHSSYITASGKPVYEHNLRSCCGQNWNSRICSDGAPQGWSLYEFKEGKLEGWTDKATDWTFDQVMRLYNGSDVYSGSTKWWVGKVSSSSTWAGKLIASVPGADPADWTLTLECDGVKTSMTPVSEAQADWCSYAFWKNFNSKNDYRSAKLSYWTVAMPTGSSWKVKARFTNPFSGKVSEYECTQLQNNFTGFAK